MEKYLTWWEANEIKDTRSVLLAREPKTFEFLDELIKTASSCVRSKKSISVWTKVGIWGVVRF